MVAEAQLLSAFCRPRQQHLSVLLVCLHPRVRAEEQRLACSLQRPDWLPPEQGPVQPRPWVLPPGTLVQEPQRVLVRLKRSSVLRPVQYQAMETTRLERGWRLANFQPLPQWLRQQELEQPQVLEQVPPPEEEAVVVGGEPL